MKSFSLLLLVLACTWISCKKNKVSPAQSQLQGNYKGTLRSDTKVTGGDSVVLLSNVVAVSINGNLYHSSSSDFEISRGSYTTSNGDLLFIDSVPHPAYYNWNILLAGRFTQSKKGDSLVWTKTFGPVSYIYTIKKQ